MALQSVKMLEVANNQQVVSKLYKPSPAIAAFSDPILQMTPISFSSPIPIIAAGFKAINLLKTFSEAEVRLFENYRFTPEDRKILKAARKKKA